MSNYTTLVLEAKRAAELRRWLDEWQCSQADQLWISVGEGRELLILAPEAEKSWLPTHDAWVRGNIVDQVGGRVSFGAPASQAAGFLPMAESSRFTGTFVAIELDESSVHFTRDLFGSAPMFTWQTRGVAVVSDSQLLLAYLQQLFTQRVRLNRKQVLARGRNSLYANQQLGRGTYLAGISYLPPGKSLRLNFDTLQFTESNSTFFTSDLQHSPSEPCTYRSTMRTVAGWTAGFTSALVNLDGARSVLSLSGGHDSRVSLAALLRTNSLNAVTIRTRRPGFGSQEDFDTVQSLSARFGFEVEYASPTPSSSDHLYTKIATWAATLLGTYDGVIGRPISSEAPKVQPFNLTGFGAEMLKYVQNSLTSREMAQKVGGTKGRQRKYEREILAGLESIGVASPGSRASSLYYCAYRHGLHGTSGRYSFSMQSTHALEQIEFLDFAFFGDQQEIPQYGPIPDITALLHPELAAAPYETAEKTLSAEYVQQRLEELGGPLRDEEVVSVRIFGTPFDTPTGPLKLALQLAADVGLNLDPDPERLSAWMVEQHPSLPFWFRNRVGDDLLAKTLWQLRTSQRALDGNRGEPGKWLAVWALSNLARKSRKLRFGTI